jgi:hypothetical protein
LIHYSAQVFYCFLVENRVRKLSYRLSSSLYSQQKTDKLYLLYAVYAEFIMLQYSMGGFLLSFIHVSSFIRSSRNYLKACAFLFEIMSKRFSSKRSEFGLSSESGSESELCVISIRLKGEQVKVTDNLEDLMGGGLSYIILPLGCIGM